MKISIAKLRRIINEVATDVPNEREELSSLYSDVYKEKHGIRPRGINWDDMSTEEMRAMLNAIQDAPGDYDWDDGLEFEEDFRNGGPVPAIVDEPIEPFEDLADAPKEIPFKGGNEYDALGGNPGIHIWRPGQRKAAKRTYNRRLRHSK